MLAWAKKESSEKNVKDYRCSKGNVEVVFSSIDILNHVVSMYTIETFLMFEKDFSDGSGYKYKEV